MCLSSKVRCLDSAAGICNLDNVNCDLENGVYEREVIDWKMPMGS